ncbi:MAG: DUF3048 domain-containing protein, partial [Ilumatobacteraceae bacterium]
ATFLLAACGSGGDSAADTSVATTVARPSSSATTLPPATDPAPPTTEPPPVESTLPVLGYAPLTGLPVTDAAYLDRPALVAKMDNHTDARPHAGLNQADIVYEEIVEGITRFFVIFQSQDAAPVGPVRSARTTDVALLNQLNRPLFVYSGGNAKVQSAIGGANIENRQHNQSLGYYRDADRRARAAVEHTLLIESTNRIYETVTDKQGPPAAFFSYHDPGAELPGGEPATKISMVMNSVPITWTWDAASGTYLREEYGETHLDSTGVQVSGTNVVIQFCQYRTSPADPKSPEAVSVGSGEAVIFTGGKIFHGTWDRPDEAKPAVFTLDDGSEVQLAPGRTWIELAQTGKTEYQASA